MGIVLLYINVPEKNIFRKGLVQFSEKEGAKFSLFLVQMCDILTPLLIYDIFMSFIG